MLQNTPARYGLVTKILHWSIAILILGLIWLGWFMVDLSYYDTWYHNSLTAHRALGILVLFLAILKLIWTFVSVKPDLPKTLKTWERLAARSVHGLLFLIMIIIPISGYIISTSSGDAVPFFDWFDIPAIVNINEQTRDIAIQLHYYFAYATIALVLLHAGAALKHQFIDKDGTLRKML